MTEEEYLKLREEFDKIGDKMYELAIAGKFNQEYEELKKYKKELESILNSYLENKIKTILSDNLSKNVETCLNMLNLLPDYSIGSHYCGYSSSIMSKPEELAESFLTKGLLLSNEGSGILQNIYMLGNENVDIKIQEKIKEFYEHLICGAKYKGGVLVAIPTTLLNENHERVYIGEFPNDLDFIGKDDKRITNLPINKFVMKNRYLPPEFILGVVSKNENGEVGFTQNNRFISQLSEEEQIEFYKELVAKGLKPGKISNSANYRR